MTVLFSALLALAVARKSAPSAGLSVIDSIVQEAIRDGQIPGAVVLVGHDGQVIYRKALGERSLEPRREAMTVDTIFDLASLTKVVATTTAVMQLVQKGQIRVNEPVAKYIPEFAENGKEEITVRELLTHFSGLAPRFGFIAAVGRSRDGAAHGLRGEAYLRARFAIPVQRRQLHCSGCARRARLGNVAAGLLREEYFCSAEDDAHALSASGVLVAEDRAHTVRRARQDAARSCARSYGATDGRSGGAGGAVLDGGRSGQVCPGFVGWQHDSVSSDG